MKRPCILFILGFVSAASLWADGGVVLDRATLKGLDLTVFASPVPLRAGPADISVLVQESGKGTPILNARVEVAWSAAPDAFPEWMPPCCSMKTGDSIAATSGHSQNKMLYSAMVPIKSSGPSKLLIKVEHEGTVVTLPCEITARSAPAPLVAYWPFLAFPPVLVAGYTMHQRLSRGGRKTGMQ